MRNTLLAILLALTMSNFSAYSQAIDSVYPKPDSLKNWYAGQVLPKPKLKPATFVLPGLLVGYGFVAVHNKGAVRNLDFTTKAELQEDHPLFAAHVDDYLQFAPIATVYALNLAGVKGDHHSFDVSMLYASSSAIMFFSTQLVKKDIGRMRPDHSGANSFPSGHTASAFMAAELLHQEYKDVNPWIGYSGYIVATATGTLRLYNNKHWFSDVVAGAGFGIASTKISYLVYPYIKGLFGSRKQSNFVLMPYYREGSTGFLFSGNLNKPRHVYQRD